MNEKIKNGIKLLVILLIFFGIGVIAAEIFERIGINPSDFSSTQLAITNVVLASIITLFCILLYFKDLKTDWLLFKEKLRENLWTSFKLFGAFMAIKVGASILTVIISLALGLDFLQSENQELIESFAISAPIAVFISAVVLAPFLEEIIFRLGFKKVINNKWLYILISGLIFGLMHIFPTDIDLALALTQSIVFVAMGLALGAMYWKRPNIWIVIIVHGLNNLLSMLVIFLL